MDTSPLIGLLNPTVIVAIVGVISAIVAGLIGRRVRAAEAEQKEASAADRLSIGYDRLVQSWELRLSAVQEDLTLIKLESAEDRKEIRRLTAAESELKKTVEDLGRELKVVTAERDELREERNALWERIAELESERGELIARIEELERALGVNGAGLTERGDDQ